jgi:hypothetical protein
VALPSKWWRSVLYVSNGGVRKAGIHWNRR